jgi:metal-responsive CopG/Arc/MetJ family transcriptional regulator
LKRKSGRPKVYGERIIIVVRLDPDLVEELNEEAIDRRVSRNYLIERAIVNFLDDGLVGLVE